MRTCILADTAFEAPIRDFHDRSPLRLEPSWSSSATSTAEATCWDSASASDLLHLGRASRTRRAQFFDGSNMLQGARHDRS
jgi:hypothetical protein